MEETGFSLDDRVMCSDGACIGVVGGDGRCKVCGKPYEGEEEISALGSLIDEPGEKTEDETDEPAAMKLDEAIGQGVDPSERVCCPDDMCIGIIGENGKCGTCGKTL